MMAVETSCVKWLEKEKGVKKSVVLELLEVARKELNQLDK